MKKEEILQKLKKPSKYIIQYNYKNKNIEFGDRILMWDGFDFDSYGRVYRMKYVDIGGKDVFGIFCKNIQGIVYPSLYMDGQMNSLLYIDRRPWYMRLLGLGLK